MKIEHIIEDIKEDIKALAVELEGKIKAAHPAVHFFISTPGLEEMSTIKAIAITLPGDTQNLYFSVLVHTHNGCRVFEHEAMVSAGGVQQSYIDRHQVQISFINGLRDIIKKKKSQSRTPKKAAVLFKSLQQFANTG